MIINNIGIGTTNPSKDFEVQGEIALLSVPQNTECGGNVTTTDADISMFMENGMLIVSG
ncbi:hypothetical protein HOD29_00150 [archaeon]|nr:hypothetical protein [archaeon]